MGPPASAGGAPPMILSLERISVASSDASEDQDFRRELMRLSRADHRVIAAIVRRILEIQQTSGPDAAEAALEMLLRDLDQVGSRSA